MSKQLTLDKLLIEASYLTVPNFYRYRSILRYFYLQHQRLQYWMVREEIFDKIKTMDGFDHYTLEQCQQDLDTLVGWKNLMAGQDAGKVQTIEEFKNRRFRYQLTPYTIEIERLMIRLESISGVGGSLEANLFERISQRIQQLPSMENEENSKVYAWWQDLSSDFQRLNDNATDYIASLESGQAEELMNTVAFLTYKDSIIEYLRSFILELHRHGPIIENTLGNMEHNVVDEVLKSILAHELTIPRVEQNFTYDDYKEEIDNRWNNLEAWFLGKGTRESEASRLLDITNGIIRKITRYAYRIAENQNRSINRRKEYMHLCRLFAGCDDVKDAHYLSAAVFGAFHTRHMVGDYERQTESISSGVWEEDAFVKEIKPKTRQYREKSHASSIRNRKKEKEQALEEYLKRQQEEQGIIQRYIKDNSIRFADLPEIEPFVRNTLLRWVGRGLANRDRTGKTEDGRTYRIHVEDLNQKIMLHCQDGNLEMPPMVLEFIS